MRKQSLMVLAVSLTLAAGVAMAAEEHHPAQKGAAPASGAGMDGKQMSMMQDHMLKMHEQMHKIMQAKDAAERERLKQEHMKMMQEHMKAMHGPGGMMGSGMPSGTQAGQPAAAHKH